MPVFFKGLAGRRFESSLAVFHQRFSTNTAAMELAQPFRSGAQR